MQFHNEVIRFDFSGIPMVGNLQSGYAIGLTDEAAQVCTALLTEEREEADLVKVDKALFEHLSLGGFFIKAKKDTSIKSAYFHVTQQCNLNCLGCYSLDDQRNVINDPSLDECKHALDELARAGLVSLIISGGEPFLRKDIAQIVRYAKETCGIASITVLSNGTCLDEAQLKEMAGYVDCVSVSFDGCSPEAPAYIREEQRFLELVDAVKAIQECGIPSHIIATIHRKNFEDMQRYSDLAAELGVGLSLSLLSCVAESDGLGELAPSEEDLVAFGKRLFESGTKGLPNVLDAPIGMNITVKHSCGAGRQNVSLAADGNVYPCHMMHVDGLSFGNLFTDSIEDIVQGSTAKGFGSLSVQDFEECSVCDYAWICGGGCRARALSDAGSLTAKDGFCSMITTFYGDLGNHLNKLYGKTERG